MYKAMENLSRVFHAEELLAVKFPQSDDDALLLTAQSGRGIGIRDEISTFAITKDALLKEAI